MSHFEVDKEYKKSLFRNKTNMNLANNPSFLTGSTGKTIVPESRRSIIGSIEDFEK